MASTDSAKSSVFRPDPLRGEQHGDEDQQPEQGIVPDFLQQWIHWCAASPIGYAKLSFAVICTLIQVKRSNADIANRPACDGGWSFPL
jgi:hypothetical protein